MMTRSTLARAERVTTGGAAPAVRRAGSGARAPATRVRWKNGLSAQAIIQVLADMGWQQC